MTTEEIIEKTLKKEGFKVRASRKRIKKLDIRKVGFEDNKTTEENIEVWKILIDYLKDITHNLTLHNIKRTIRLVKDIVKWMWKKDG